MIKLSLLTVTVLVLTACQHHSGHKNDDHATHHMHHQSHDTQEVTATDKPTVTLEIFEDPKSGWNIRIVPNNFVFSPQNSGKQHVEGEGHAHLYVNDVKIGRLYGEWYHYDGTLEPGEHEVRVTLNTNDHKDLTINDQVVSAGGYILVTK